MIWARKGFLIGLPYLYFLSLVLPALHGGGRFNGSVPGFFALYGAILALPYCSIDDGPRILVWMSVQANAFIFLGWLAVAFPSLYFGRRAAGLDRMGPCIHRARPDAIDLVG